MAKKTSTAPASAEKTAQKADKTIKKVKKVNHPWKNLRVAFVGPCIYQETAPRTIIMMEDEDSTAPLVKKMGAKFAGHGLSKAQVVVVGDQERMIKGEVRPHRHVERAHTAHPHPPLSRPPARARV